MNMEYGTTSAEDWGSYSKYDNMGIRTRAQVKELVKNSKIKSIIEYSDFKNLVVEIVKNNKVYKSYLIMAIIEIYFVDQSQKIDCSCGVDKIRYDYINSKIMQFTYNNILEPYVKGEVLKLKVQKTISNIEAKVVPPQYNWVEESGGISQEDMDHLVLTLKIRREHKKYQVANEELHIKHHRRNKAKYEQKIVIGDLT